MKRSSTFYDVPKNTHTDATTEFISGFSFSLNAIGHHSHDPSKVCGDRITGDFELIFVKGGKSLITIAETTYECTAGHSVLIPPFTLQRIQTTADDPHDIYWMHFEVYPIQRQNEFLNALTPQGSHRTAVACFEDMLAIYAGIEREINHPMPGCMAFCTSSLVQIVILLLRQSGGMLPSAGMPSRESQKDAGIVNDSLAYIRSRLDCDIGVDSLCESLHVSRSRLFKAFSKVLGGSPNHFIQLFKVKKAEQLMKSTGLSCKEISQALSFSSPYYFSSVFKKFYKMPPSDYIKTFQPE